MKTFFNKTISLLIICLCCYTADMNAQCVGWTPITVEQGNEFDNELPIPSLITRPDYHLVIHDTLHNFDPSGDTLNTPIRTFVFNDINNRQNTILGPTIAWQFKEQVRAKITNELDEVTTTHWHGAHVPAHVDGGPHQRIWPDSTWHPSFEVLDKSATMWYHPHAMDLTYRHVQMGLSGMIYVEDSVGEDPILTAIHNAIPHTYGIDDFPIIMQTKQFRQDSTGEIRIFREFGFGDRFMRMVNGVIDPCLEVPQNVVRFRMLNGDGKFAFNIGVGKKRSASEFDPIGFHFIATDAGYTDKSYPMNEVLISPGERTEWLVDFRQFNVGDTLFIYNKQSDIKGEDVIGRAFGDEKDQALLKLIVKENNIVPTSNLLFPIQLHPSEAPPLSAVTNTRTKVFRKDKFDFDPPIINCKPNGADFRLDTARRVNVFNIDSTLMDMRVVNDTVMLGATELWTIVNNTDHAHPWHIHDIHFWVKEVETRHGVFTSENAPDSLIHIFKGPKDNVLVREGWKLTYIATFDDFGTEIKFSNSYMYHCHILPHEDRGMMGQFVVWDGSVTTNTEDVTREQTMKVYPNPTDGLLYLEGNSQAESLVRVTDIRGRVLRELQVAPFSGAISLNLENMPTGIVFVQWFTDKGRAVRKVILK